MSYAGGPTDGRALAARLDETLTGSLGESRAPGVQAAVVARGEVLWTGCAGRAVLDPAAPVTDDTVFCLASLGKTMLAALVLRLVEDGRLDLDVPVAAVVGADVPGATVVTPRLLLTHTSGYPDLYEAPEVKPLLPPDPGSDGGEDYRPDRTFTWATLAPGLREPVDPGTRWDYSNTGYLVLTEVLARVLGGPGAIGPAWSDLAARADRPLGDDLLTLDRSAVPLDRLAHGYDEQGDGRFVDPYAAHRPTGVPTDLFGLPFGDGLFAGTAMGVALFLDALFVRGRLLRPATVDLMTTPSLPAATADDPEGATYGMGTFRVTTAAGAWQGHRGRYGGFSTMGASQRDRGLTLVVLSNGLTDEVPAVVVWRALADALG